MFLHLFQCIKRCLYQTNQRWLQSCRQTIEVIQLKNQYVSTSSKVQLCKHSGGSRGGARRGPPTPLHLDQTEARRAEKIFFGGPPPPPLSQDLDDWPLPPYWKIWIHHCHWLFVDLISALMKTKPGLTVSSEVSDS